MPNWIIRPEGLSEPFQAPVIWIDGIAAVSVEDGVVSTYYTSQRPNFYANGMDTVVEVVLKRTVKSLFAGVSQGSQTLAHCRKIMKIDTPVFTGPHLVR